MSDTETISRDRQAQTPSHDHRVLRLSNAFIIGGVLLVATISSLYPYMKKNIAYESPRALTSADSSASLDKSSLIDSYHKLFYNDPNTWPKNTWLGISTLQNPNDVWITQEIISEVQPDFVIETGTYLGGSALVWAMVLAQVNHNGRVITIDIKDYGSQAREMPLARKRIDFVIGSSTDPKIVEDIRRRVQGRKVLVILDSDHSKQHVLSELEMYSKFVSLGSYMIVQDTNVNGHPVLKDFGPGPMEAVNEFLARNNKFKSDLSRERLLFTMHPNGFLQKIK